LARGDYVFVFQDGRLCEEEILSKHFASEKVAVFNLQVSVGTYFAGGFVVHNKLTQSWLQNFIAFFNSYMLLLPYRVTSTLVIDLFPVIVGIFAIVLVAVGLTLSRKKN
jgi:hypothetical protein